MCKYSVSTLEKSDDFLKTPESLHFCDLQFDIPFTEKCIKSSLCSFTGPGERESVCIYELPPSVPPCFTINSETVSLITFKTVMLSTHC